MNSNQSIISVKEFVEILNETLSFAFPMVIVEGEVHSFKVNQQKWIFFDLKDEEASLSCFMPLFALKVPLEDGMKVRVSGVPKLTKWGKFSFTVKSVELAGEGELQRAFELLKSRLGAEGLFDEARKRPLPSYPQRIGLITSAGSAAYGDFMKILGQRWGGLEVAVADVQVQGSPAPGQIVSAIHYFNQLAQPMDVLVLIRGGGSLEDLQAFNTEEVARAVATSRTPMVVGVGHEVDVSLADFASDVRAATPTDAARLTVPDRLQVAQMVEYRRAALVREVEKRVVESGGRIYRSVEAMTRFLSGPQERLANQVVILRREFDRLNHQLAGYRQTVTNLSSLLVNRQVQGIQTTKLKLAALNRLLDGFSPKANLARGYSIIRHDEVIVKSARQVSSGDHLMIQLADGHLSSEVE